jgi:hypothetical protein
MPSPNPEPSAQPTFEDFKKMARDETLSSYGKIGFPDSYRSDKEGLIFDDILAKLPNLRERGQVVLEIGPGCSGPARMMIDLCRRQENQLLLSDSEEMLGHLPNEAFIAKFAGRYPDQCGSLFESYRGKVNVIVCYSVLHYIFSETNLFDFLDHSLGLLAPGGQMLVGDIPNQSKRKRFFSSATGIKFHQEFTGRDEVPEVELLAIETGKIDDSVLIGLVMRARAAGYDAYLVPQPPALPMANRREDLLISRP